MSEIGKKLDASDDITIKKQSLRQNFKSMLSRIPGDERRLYEFDLKKNLEAFLFEHCPQPAIWASYMPMATEANPHVENSQITWVYPKTFGEDMKFYAPAQGVAFESGALGVTEPDPQTSTQVEKNQIQGMLIPGLAFGLKGQRLGRGKAYYDKYLTGFQGLKVGLAFQVQVTEEIPMTAHDVTMDYIITNEQIVKCEDING